MTTPPLNMYMTTPAPIAHRKQTDRVRPQTVSQHQHPSRAHSHAQSRSQSRAPSQTPSASQQYRHFNVAPPSDHNEKENEPQIKNMTDEQLVDVLLTRNQQFIKSLQDEKNVLKYI